MPPVSLSSQQHSTHVRRLRPSRCRSDKQPAGQPDDPGSRHQGPGQRAEPAEGQSDEAGRREGVAAHPVPGPGGPAETAAPVPGEGLSSV